MSEREPDIDDDPRKQGAGQGYPESNPADQTPREGTESGPEAGTGGGADERAPDTDSGEAAPPRGPRATPAPPAGTSAG